jgi:malonyl CoA-acyl carrier protein transacylase
MPTVFLGHSVGEYSALTAAGALNFSDAMKLVQIRGKLMEGAQRNKEEMGMAALIPAPSKFADMRHKLQEIDNVDIAAFNSRNQIMISGFKKDVTTCCDYLKSLKLLRVSKVLENVHIAFHSRLMSEAKKEFMEEIESVNFMPLKPDCQFISNNSAQATSHDQVKELLLRQFTEPVLWQPSIETCLQVDPSMTFIEFGPGKVLSNMLKKDFGIENVADFPETCK